jgi:ATP-dependent Zn protease
MQNVLSTASGVNQPRSPLLEELHGMDKARAWGEALVRDLADYKANSIAWADVDRGAVLYGPPGCGKTTFAKALASSAGVPLVVASYAKWQRARDGHLGDVLSAMARDFNMAKRCAPSIFFIDELDVFPPRECLPSNNRDWWFSVNGALLEGLDGATGREGVVMLGACNLIERLDPALVRAGRFDQTIEIGLPTPAALEKIYRYYLGVELSGEALVGLANASLGSTGADIERIVRCGRRIARHQRRALALEDLFSAVDDGGAALPPELRRRAAVHEAGHAVVAIRLGLAGEVSISLARQRNVGGRAAYALLPHDGTRKAIEGMISVALAGRAAEEVIFRNVSASAGGSEDSDLARATMLAIRMIGNFGLSDHGRLLWRGDASAGMLQAFPALGEEVERILCRCYVRARRVLRRHAADVRAVADLATERLGLSDAEIRAVLAQDRRSGRRKRRGASNDAETF